MSPGSEGKLLCVVAEWEGEDGGSSRQTRGSLHASEDGGDCSMLAAVATVTVPVGVCGCGVERRTEHRIKGIVS